MASVNVEGDKTVHGDPFSDSDYNFYRYAYEYQDYDGDDKRWRDKGGDYSKSSSFTGIYSYFTFALVDTNDNLIIDNEKVETSIKNFKGKCNRR